MTSWEADQIIGYTYSNSCDVNTLKSILRGAIERLGSISTGSVHCPEAFANSSLKLLMNEVCYSNCLNRAKGDKET